MRKLCCILVAAILVLWVVGATGFIDFHVCIAAPASC